MSQNDCDLLYLVKIPIEQGYFFPSGDRDLTRRCSGCNRIQEPSERGSFEYDGRQPGDFATGIGRKLCKSSVAEVWEKDFPEVKTFPIVLTSGAGRWFARDPYKEIGLDTLIEPDLSLPRFSGLGQCSVCDVIDFGGQAGKLLEPEYFDGDPSNPKNVVARLSQLGGRSFAWLQWRCFVCTERGKDYLEEKGWSGLVIRPLGFLSD